MQTCRVEKILIGAPAKLSPLQNRYDRLENEQAHTVVMTTDPPVKPTPKLGETLGVPLWIGCVSQCIENTYAHILPTTSDSSSVNVTS